MNSAPQKNTPWKNKLRLIRWCLRGLLITRGVSWWLIVAVIAFWAICLLDLLVQSDSRVMRVVLTGVWLGTVLVAFWRVLWQPLHTRLTDLQLALRIEKLFPELEGRLSCSVDLSGNIETSGLSSQPIFDEKTALIWQEVSVWSVLDSRRIRYNLSGVLLVMMASFALMTHSPGTLRYSAGRMISPSHETAWSQHHELVFLTEEYLETETLGPVKPGSIMQVRVASKSGELPADMRLEIRTDSTGSIYSKSFDQEIVNINDHAERTIGLTTLLIPQDKISLRVRFDNDQAMPWYPVTLIPELKVISGNWTIKYPEYLKLKPEYFDDEKSEIKVPVGTLLEFAGKLNRPADQSVLRLSYEQEQNENSVPGTSDQLHFKIPLNQSGQYQPILEWKTVEELQPIPLQITIIVAEDQGPRLKITEPRNQIEVTNRAVVPVKLEAQDDWGLKSIKVTLSQKGRAEALTVIEREPETAKREYSDHFLLDLQGYSVRPGMVLRITGEAFDFHEMRMENVEGTQYREINVYSSDRIRLNILEQVFAFKNDLTQIRRVLQESMAGATRLPYGSEQTQKLVNTLYQQQEQMSKLLNAAETGVVPRFQKLAESVQLNRLSNEPFSPMVMMFDQQLNLLSQTQSVEMTSGWKQLDREFSTLNEQAFTVQFESLLSQEKEFQDRLEATERILQIWEPLYEIERQLVKISNKQSFLLDQLQTQYDSETILSNRAESIEAQKQIQQEWSSLIQRLVSLQKQQSPDVKLVAAFQEQIQKQQVEQLFDRVLHEMNILDYDVVLTTQEETRSALGQLHEWFKQILLALPKGASEKGQTSANQMAQSNVKIGEFISQQTSINADTKSLYNNFQSESEWTKLLLREMMDLQSRQIKLMREWDSIESSASIVFDIGDLLKRIVDQLQSRNTGLQTQSLQMALLHRLKQVADQLQLDESVNVTTEDQTKDAVPQNSTGEGTPGEGSSGQGPVDSQAVTKQPKEGEFDLLNAEYSVWGHLPERLRLRVFSDVLQSPLPEYKEAVNRYFEQLAVPDAE